MRTWWKVSGFAVACGVGALTIFVLRRPPVPAAALVQPTVDVRGFAELPERIDPFLGGSFHVRLLDVVSPDTSGLVLATFNSAVAPNSRSIGWTIQVPAERAKQAEDAYFVFSVNDRYGVKYIGSGFPRELTYLPRGAPPRLEMLGIKLTAAPAP